MQYICSKTGDEGNIYSARQGVRACNNTTMHNPIITRCRGLRMLVLLHALISYLAVYILHLFSNFLALYPYILQHLMEMFLLPCFTAFLLHTRLPIQCSLRVCEPHPICCLWSCEMYVSNNEEMAFTYTEVLVYRSFIRRRRVLQKFRW